MAMKTEAATARAAGDPRKVEEIELDAPGSGEVLDRLVASGMFLSAEG
jgi:Zn-dependent alcohol dehydrogenase